MKYALPLMLALCAGAAHASTDGLVYGGLSNLHFEVIDLTPDDGVAASLSTASNSAMFIYSAISSDQVTYEYIQSNWRSWNAQPISHNYGSALGRVSTYADDQNFTFSAMNTGAYLSYAVSQAQYYGTLSANTAVRLTGMLYLDGNAGNVFSNYNSFYMYASSGQYERMFQDANGTYQSQTVDILVSNNSANSMNFMFSYYGNASVQVAPAVPEADTWAMLGAGLLGLGALARRRKQAA
ncbi:PEP-CTERM sorting domain-containing protein [Massilia sp. W12]|uniref:PEP-CTERM sorting domain-containing protein n=1 Tax=Massilia sp. W12 TaxID=3126507 RepID=UPI0030D2F6D5